MKNRRVFVFVLISSQSLDHEYKGILFRKESNGCFFYEVASQNGRVSQFVKQVFRRLFQQGVAIGLRPDRFKPQAFFFDFDETIIEQESFVNIAQALGLSDQVAHLTSQAMTGNTAFASSFNQRLAMFKGLSKQRLLAAVGTCTFSAGFLGFLARCRKQQIPVYIVSGGTTIVIEHLCQSLDISGICANEIEIQDGLLTGRATGPMVDGVYKRTWMLQTCHSRGYDSAKVVAVGDGANDQQMLTAAGLGVGFLPKPVLLPHLNVYNGLGDHSFLGTFFEL